MELLRCGYVSSFRSTPAGLPSSSRLAPGRPNKRRRRSPRSFGALHRAIEPCPFKVLGASLPKPQTALAPKKSRGLGPALQSLGPRGPIRTWSRAQTEDRRQKASDSAQSASCCDHGFWSQVWTDCEEVPGIGHMPSDMQDAGMWRLRGIPCWAVGVLNSPAPPTCSHSAAEPGSLYNTTLLYWRLVLES